MIPHKCQPGSYCALCSHNKSGANAVGAPRVAPEPPIVPCVHRGDVAPTASVVAAGFNPARDHHQCGHPRFPLGLVSSCKTCGGGSKAPFCGDGCGGYTAEEIVPLAPPPRITLDLGAGGLGDACQGLWVALGVAADNPDTPVAFNCGPVKHWLDLFDTPGVTIGTTAKVHNEDPTPDARQMNIGYTKERDTQIAEPRWERYMRNVGATRLVPPRLTNRERLLAAGAEFSGAVVLCPWSTGRWSEWSIHAWLDLEARLHKAGYKTVVLHSEEARCERLKGEKLIGQSPERVASALLNAVAVVAIDSGLAHFSGTLGVPLIVLGGATTVQQIFGCYPTARMIQGGLPCSGCFHATPDVNALCRENCSNLHSISPERVLAAVDAIALPGIATQSLVSAERLAVIRDCVRETNHLGTPASSRNVLLVDDRPSRWELFRVHFPDATFARTEADYFAAIRRGGWSHIFLDHDLCEEVECIAAQWNGVAVCRDLVSRGFGGVVTLVTTNAAAGPKMLAALTPLGRPVEWTPFDDMGWKRFTVMNPGAIAELGVYLGGTAKLIAHYAPGAALHLYDTFEGIPETDSMAGGHDKGDFPSNAAMVQLAIPSATLHVGCFPATAPDDATRYRFANLDGDTYQSTAAALDYFGPRMVPGGIICLDDYGWHKCPGVARAVHERYDGSRISTPARFQAVLRF